MQSIIIFFTFFCVLYAVFTYINDSPSFANGKIHNLKKPSVLDLSGNPNLTTVNDYVNLVVIPLQNFFSLDCKLNSDDDARILQKFYLVIPFVFIYKSLLSEYSYFYAILVTFIFILFGIAAAWCISSVYKQFFNIKPFETSENTLREYAQKQNKIFPISDQAAFNNLVIEHYLHYYYSIDKSVSRRITLRKILNALLCIIYLLYFWTNPYD